MAATKQEEREALLQIKKIIAGLGEDSYVGAAFEGCFEIAESNIRDDAMCSPEQVKLDLARMEKRYEGKIRRLEEQVKELTLLLEEEQEWREYQDPRNVCQGEYDDLADDPCATVLTDEKARDLICREFGFAPERVDIQRNITIWQRNRHGVLREAGETAREPLYSATDMNYVRFWCGGSRMKCTTATSASRTEGRWNGCPGIISMNSPAPSRTFRGACGPTGMKSSACRQKRRTPSQTFWKPSAAGTARNAPSLPGITTRRRTPAWMRKIS